MEQSCNQAYFGQGYPNLFAAVAVLYGVLDRKSSPLSPVLRSLVMVRVSQINWCRFCVDINSATLAKRSGSMEKVEKLSQWKESDLFDKKEKVVLEYTEAITYTDRQVTDELMQRLKNFFDDDGIVELTGLIAFQNLSSKFNSALDVPPQGFCKSSETSPKKPSTLISPSSSGISFTIRPSAARSILSRHLCWA